MKLINIFSASVVSCFFSSFAMANTTSHPELSVAGGYSRVNFSSLSLPVTATETDTLHQTNSSTAVLGMLGLSQVFVFDYPKQHIHNVSVGLNLYNLSTTNAGDVYQYGVPALNNFIYRLPIKSTRLMLDGKIMSCPWHRLSTFLLGGIGGAWNRVKYYDAPTVEGASGISLESREQVKFAYEVGIGWQLTLDKHVSFFAEYLYANLGDMKTSSYGSPSVLSGITFPLYVNTALFGVNVTIG